MKPRQSYSTHGKDTKAAAEIDGLAKQHGVTFTSGGILDMSRVWSGILLLGPCTEIQALHHIADKKHRGLFTVTWANMSRGV